MTRIGMVGQASAQCHLLCPWQRSTLIVGWAILPAAAFQAALPGHARACALGKRRLKAGGSQDWLPHDLCRAVTRPKVSGIGISACRSSDNFPELGR